MGWDPLRACSAQETPRTTPVQRSWQSALARAVPHEGQADRSMPTLTCGRSLIVLNERGRVIRGYAFDESA